MSEHENGNFVLKCGQNQQKYQSFMAISDFALLYRIRRCGVRCQSLSYPNSSCGCGYSPYYPQVSFTYAGRRGGFIWKKPQKIPSGHHPEGIKWNQKPSPTTWALMRLVVPDLPRGTPAVMTTVSPGFTAPSFRATSTARENIRSVESTSPDR